MAELTFHSIDSFVEYLSFLQRGLIERGNREKDRELHRAIGKCVEHLNEAARDLNTNYSPIHIGKFIELKRCPSCGQCIN